MRVMADDERCIAECGGTKYMYFSAYVPAVHQMIDGSLTIELFQNPTEDAEVVRRCIDFVVGDAVLFGV